MKRIQGLLLTALLLGASLLPATAANETPQALALLEIRGLDSLASAGFELSKASGNAVPKEMIALGLYGALGTMPGMGIPPESTVRAMAFKSAAPRGGWALLLPVENEGADYFASLAQNGWQNETETPDGILHFVAPPGLLVPLQDVYFLKRGATLVAAGSADDVRRAEAIRPTLPPILPAEGDVVFQIRPAALAEAYGAEIGAQLDQAFQAPGAPPELAKMGRLYAQTYLAAARQVREFVLGLGVADGNFNVHSRLAPVPGSTFAAWVATVQPPAAATQVVALPDALAVETLNLGNPQLLLPAYFRFMEELLATLPPGAATAQTESYLAAEKAAYEQLAGDVGLALLPPTPESPLRLAQYVALKDAAAVRGRLPDLVKGSADMMAALAAESEEDLPFEIKLELGEPRTYRDVAIDRLTYAFQLDGPVAEIWPAAIPTKYDIELAWVPGGALSTVGDAALTETLVDRALDGGAAPATARPGWQALYPEPDDRLVEVADVAIFDVLRAYLALADAAKGSQLAQQVPDSPGHLATSSYVFDGLMTRLRFRLADLAAASGKTKALQAPASSDLPMPMEPQDGSGLEEEADMEAEEADRPAADEAEAAPEPPAVEAAPEAPATE